MSVSSCTSPPFSPLSLSLSVRLFLYLSPRLSSGSVPICPSLPVPLPRLSSGSVPICPSLPVPLPPSLLCLCPYLSVSSCTSPPVSPLSLSLSVRLFLYLSPFSPLSLSLSVRLFLYLSPRLSSVSVPICPFLPVPLPPSLLCLCPYLSVSSCTSPPSLLCLCPYLSVSSCTSPPVSPLSLSLSVRLFLYLSPSLLCLCPYLSVSSCTSPPVSPLSLSLSVRFFLYLSPSLLCPYLSVSSCTSLPPPPSLLCLCPYLSVSSCTSPPVSPLSLSLSVRLFLYLSPFSPLSLSVRLFLYLSPRLSSVSVPICPSLPVPLPPSLLCLCPYPFRSPLPSPLPFTPSFTVCILSLLGPSLFASLCLSLSSLSLSFPHPLSVSCRYMSVHLSVCPSVCLSVSPCGRVSLSPSSPLTTRYLCLSHCVSTYLSPTPSPQSIWKCPQS